MPLRRPRLTTGLLAAAVAVLAAAALLLAGHPAAPRHRRARPHPSAGPTPPASAGRTPTRSTPTPIAPSASRTAPTPAPAGPLPGTTQPGALPPVVAHGPRTGKLVALTFDADMTDSMLRLLDIGQVRSYANVRVVETLERQRIPATFFLTGKWAQRYPQLTARLAANPRFELANHSYGHLAFTRRCYGLPRLRPAAMTDDVARTFTVITPYGGRQTRYFRFPGLCHDRAALAALAPLGVTVVDADVVSGDPFATAWQPIARRVLAGVRPGSVIVLHVTEANAPMTDEALPHILAGLRARGLIPATLSEVLAGRPAPPSAR